MAQRASLLGQSGNAAHADHGLFAGDGFFAAANLRSATNDALFGISIATSEKYTLSGRPVPIPTAPSEKAASLAAQTRLPIDEDRQRVADRGKRELELETSTHLCAARELGEHVLSRRAIGRSL